VLLDSDPPSAVDRLAGEVLRKPRKAARVAGSLIGQALGLSHLEGMVTRQSVRTGARVRYRPKPYPGEAILITAAEREQTVDQVRRWHRFVTGQLTAVDVPGDHVSMLQEPLVGGLARVLTRLL
jgi:thioesterase domain-containing protein